MIAMEGLCDRVIWMRQGRLVEDGPARAVVASYLRSVATTQSEREWTDPGTAPGNEHVRMRAVRVRPEGGKSGDAISVETPFVIEFEYWRADASARLVPTLHLYNQQGSTVFNVGPVQQSAWQEPAGRTDPHSRRLPRPGQPPERRPPPRLLRVDQRTRERLLAG